MGNKQQLQLNNETLTSILSNVLGIPSQESLKHGAYVWKKYQYTPPINVTFTGTTTSQNPSLFTGTSDDIDMSKATANDLVGMKGTISSNGSACEFISETRVTLGTSTYSYTYTPSTQTLSIPTQFSNKFNINVGYDEVKTFVDFTVSDSPTAYPDGAEQGGYWYEKISDFEGFLQIPYFKKVLVEKITPATNLKDIPHNLGMIPRFAIIFANEDYERTDNKTILFGAVIHAVPYGTTSAITRRYFVELGAGTHWSNYGSAAAIEHPSSGSDTIDSSSISLSSTLLAGVEYTVITMA